MGDNDKLCLAEHLIRYDIIDLFFQIFEAKFVVVIDHRAYYTIKQSFFLAFWFIYPLAIELPSLLFRNIIRISTPWLSRLTPADRQMIAFGFS